MRGPWMKAKATAVSRKYLLAPNIDLNLQKGYFFG